MRRKKSVKNSDSAVIHISRSFLLCATLFVVWYAVMLLTGWYDARFHVLATFSSAILMAGGIGGGIVERLAS